MEFNTTKSSSIFAAATETCATEYFLKKLNELGQNTFLDENDFDDEEFLRQLNELGGNTSLDENGTDDDDTVQKFEIISETNSKVRQYNLNGRKIVFKIRDIPDGEDALDWVKEAVNDIIRRISSDIEPEDKVGFTFTSENFKEKGAGWMAFRDGKNVTIEDVWEVLGGIFQSNSEGLATDKFRLTVTYVKLPKGSGKIRSSKFNTYEEECKKRRGIIFIKNDDNLCLLRAIVVAKAHIKKDINLKRICRNCHNIQTEKVNKLLRKTRLIIPEQGAGVEELNILQRHLRKYKITVYKHQSKGREVVFEGNNDDAIYKINLLLHQNHYNVITSLTAAFCCSYYCEACHTPFNGKNEHRCGATCPCCQQSPPCEKENEDISCERCNREFRSQQCFENHCKEKSLGKNSVCNLIKRCDKCLKTFNMKMRKQKHECGEIFCKICGRYIPAGHFCYISKNDTRPKLDNTLFIFFDLETKQEKPLNKETDTMVHEPNLCVYMQCCDICIKDDSKRYCEKCGLRQHVLKDNVIETFMKQILNIRKKFKKVFCIAHNGQAFDHQFILKYVFENTHLQPNLIMRGSKILMLQLENVRFIDSLNYFPMALAALPKAFDLPPSLKKGYFPHFFNTEENKNYVGPLPAISYYSPDTMKGTDDPEIDDERKKFLKWYKETKESGYVFDMQKEIVDYCTSDVDILKKACLRFREAFLQECNVCPFSEAITIASACNLVFRRKFIQPNTIGIIPRGGYRQADIQSRIALQWLIHEENERQILIQLAGKQREVVLPGTSFKVDGYCEETKQVFEFHGCYYHGHDLCQSTRRDEPLHEQPDDTLNLRLERTKTKTKKIRELGYEVIEMWECEFRKKMKKNANEFKYLEQHPLLNSVPINPRDAFYGGRTGCTKLYYKAGYNEKIKYVDVCSLYPWVCKYGKFPLGHPKIFVGDDECKNLINNNGINNCNGIIKCKILPPENLYHPVLPVKQNNKLMFVLCRSCGEDCNQGECTHSIGQRALTGTWITDEVAKAVSLGYQVLEVYEMWQYQVTQYDCTTGTGGLFVEFINKFLKMKQEASGWPAKCKTEEERSKYIEEYFENEGVRLEFEKIVKNPGLRSLAKLMLNSFWGKFGQRENQPKTSIIHEPKDLYDILTNPSVDVNFIQEINEETIIVNWEQKDEAADLLSTVNCVIAAYVTAQARLKLYGYLEKLQERVLYYDTDSVIYILRDNEYEPPTGSFLGDMTDELEDYGVGSYITEFVSGGPKMYGYTVYSTNENKIKPPICKFKGITLNYKSGQLANFDTLKQMILEDAPPTTIISRNIRRTEDHDLVTKTETKIFKPTFNKRRRIQNFDSVPYGFKRQRTE